MKTLQLKPMNRNPFGDGADEMINLRSKNGVLETVGKKKALISGANAYTDMLVHSFDGNTNYIAVSDTSIDWIDIETEGVKGNIITNLETPIKSVQTVNNTIVFATDDTMYISYFKSEEYDTEGAYSTAVGGMPLAPMYTGKVVSVDKIITLDVYPDTEPDIAVKLNAKYQEHFDKSVGENLPEGWILTRVAYRLANGDTTMLSSPCLFMIGNVDRISQTIKQSNTHYKIERINSGILTLDIAGCADNNYKDIITGVVVYSTRVLTRFDFSKSSAGVWDMVGNISQFFRRDIEKQFDNELYYKIDEIPYENLHGSREVTINTTTLKDITSNEESTVDDGCISKTGEMFMFNKRVHLYNTTSKSSRIGYYSIASTGFTTGDSQPELASVYAKVNRNSSSYYIYLCSIPVVNNQIFLHRLVTIPYMAESLVFVTGKPEDRMGLIEPLTQSKRHNYSYFIPWSRFAEDYELTDNSLNSDFNFPIENIANPSSPLGKDTYLGKDTDNLIVSEANYPLIYPVQNSYLMPGNIIDLSINTTQITQSQIGQYPLYIFTTAGIYGLEQGQGNVLYARTIPLSIEMAIETCQTPYGIVFSTDNGLKVINGGNVTELSLDIDISLNHDIRDHASFKTCTDHELLCRVQPYISTVNFVAYLKGAVIGYDSREKEVIISNPSRAYSYAYSFLGRYWMKRGESYSWFNGNIALTPMIEGATTRPINLLNEEETVTLPIVYLTVPLALDDHTTIKRSALRGDFKPKNNHMGVYMFASVDKIHWDLVNSMQFKEDTPHVLLSRIATTYRWIVLLVCGDTDGTRLAYLEINDVPKYTGNLR